MLVLCDIAEQLFEQFLELTKAIKSLLYFFYSGNNVDTGSSNHTSGRHVLGPEWTLAGADGATDGYLGADPTSGHYFVNDHPSSSLFMDPGSAGGLGGGMDCSDFDDCSAYASADAFAVF